MRLLTGLASALLLSGCAGIVPKSADPVPPSSGGEAFTSAMMAGVKEGPFVSSLSISQTDAEAALRSFIESCPTLLRREDKSGLTQPSDWQKACAAAPRNPGTADTFFSAYFETAIVGSGQAFATGYFEPEIAGCRTRKPGCEVPVYALPGDLIRQWPADMAQSERTGRPPLGRINENGVFVPYFERSEIDAGALEGRGLAFAWAKDPVEMFFLQIQGSGRLALDDGGVMRIGYAGQNGRGYTGIGGVMRERGLLGDGPGQYAGSMQGIMQYIRENPQDGKELMHLNKSWIFFTELTGDGPLGSLGIPVRRESSVAVDPRFVPYGAPVFLDLDRNIADGLWIAQDTGGAIKGPNRFDTFWGAGEDARTIAGGMSGRGQALILLPRGTVKRLNSQ
ncbi:murein transglycosylase A [Altererythrobacter sp. RZ02]|uniref:peptidoglycan lytic exotransglycosylase n=1 Tax=Pontixanthobacter rizhaonensis TaxID=2730337 RepID=A0A848QNV6_9SPHN|nr:murein transglycosylase A [Pontixanthobacter rizhaonensis]NMW32297.1 murein transglycosylase A [Pontixanthobacter rizhaonensis]